MSHRVGEKNPRGPVTIGYRLRISMVDRGNTIDIRGPNTKGTCDDPAASRGHIGLTPTLHKPRPVRQASGLRLSPGRWSAGQQGNHPAGLRARLYEVPLRRGADGGVQGSGMGGAGAQAGTVGTPAVIFVAEDCLLSAVSPLGDVTWQTRDDDTCQPGQAGSLSVAGRPVSNYVWCPRNSVAIMDN